MLLCSLDLLKMMNKLIFHYVDLEFKPYVRLQLSGVKVVFPSHASHRTRPPHNVFLPQEPLCSGGCSSNSVRAHYHRGTLKASSNARSASYCFGFLFYFVFFKTRNASGS